jgi:CubicO group peptidase (beta-lactamase class C family)
MGIGPITSAFTAAQVMLLADRQQVDLNAPVDDYVDVPFDTNRATVRDLLSMRSGFPNDPASGIFEAASADMDQVLTSADWYDLVNPEDPRDSERGQTSSFNGLNFIVLGDLIETVTGEPFAAVLRRDLLAPAGLARAWIQAAEEPTAPTAVGVDDPEFPLVDADGPWLPSRALGSGTGSAGGMAADAPTLASWGLALYTGQLLDPDVVAQMTTSPDDSWYGLGTMIKTDSTGATMVGHDGNQGHVYTSTLLVWPDDNIAVAVLSPQGPTKPLDALAQRLHSTWVDEHPQ